MARPTDADPAEDEARDDPRRHEHDPARPEADSLEQELAVEDEDITLVPDDERPEPLGDGYEYGE